MSIRQAPLSKDSVCFNFLRSLSGKLSNCDKENSIITTDLFPIYGPSTRKKSELSNEDELNLSEINVSLETYGSNDKG